MLQILMNSEVLWTLLAENFGQKIRQNFPSRLFTSPHAKNNSVNNDDNEYYFGSH
jgi:hypothetical protein